MSADNLKRLHTALVDTRNGYQKAVEDASSPAARALFSEMVALKQKDHAELHQGLSRLGEKPDENGSFMSTVHKAVIGVRAAVTGPGTNSLSSFVMGEKQIIEDYDKAIEECASDPQITETLRRQKTALQAKIAQMEAMET